MNDNTQFFAKTLRARLTLNVSYLVKKESPTYMLYRLKKMCERAIDLGLLVGDTSAEVQTYELKVNVPPRLRSDVEIAALESEISSYLRQCMEGGDFNVEDTPMRLARYGLMASEDFLSEMCERMEIALDDEVKPYTCVLTSTDPDSGNEFEMLIAVACTNASGMADMPVFTVKVTQNEYDLGVHYDKAKVLAGEARYEGPFICFDVAEHGAILSAAKALDLVPQVVVVDATDGEVRDARTDVGTIKVVCYDTDYAHYEPSDLVSEHPLGVNGEPIYCWAFSQRAKSDSGLKKARRYL